MLHHSLCCISNEFEMQHSLFLYLSQMILLIIYKSAICLSLEMLKHGKAQGQLNYTPFVRHKLIIESELLMTRIKNHSGRKPLNGCYN